MCTFKVVLLLQLGLLSVFCNESDPVRQFDSNCVLPELPKRGNYSIVGSPETPIPGALIAEKETLQYNCIAKNGGPSDQVIVCSKGIWLPSVLECADTPSECGDVEGETSGVYVIQPTINGEPFEVYCDLTLTGQKWTVLQQRLSADVDFFRNYTEYSQGFGSKNGNHWLGLEHLHEITKDGNHELYVELEAHDGTKAYARYDTFIVGSSSTGFEVTITGYSGTAGDSLAYSGGSLNGTKFTTFDNDQDDWSFNYADISHGAWWYGSFTDSNLNGRYYNSAVNTMESMYWAQNFGWYIALKTSRMLTRKK